MFDAVVDQRGCGLGQLQHGEAVVALTNAQRNRLACVPFLLFRTFVIVAFPILAGQHATHFTKDIDAGDLAKAQRLHEIVHGVHTHFIGQRVEVRVAGLDDGAVHVHRASALVLRTAKTVSAKHVKTGVVDDGSGRARSKLQRRHRHERLVGGAGRVGAPQRTVEQGFVNGLVQRFPAFGVDAIHKQVGVERRLAHKGQHLAGFGVQRHQRAPAITIQVFNQVLQLDVDGQHDRVARGGRAAGQLAHRTASR